LTGIELAGALSSLAVPTLMIAGENDRLTPPRHAQRMARSLPDLLDVVVLPRSGHMSPLEFPDRVNSLLAELAGTTAAPIAAG
jgi:pimeloyl-ACP methyl ester carboxylesterase